MTQTQTRTNQDESPVALFYVLEDARRRKDFHAAAWAQRRLAELGVVVTYRPDRRIRR